MENQQEQQIQNQQHFGYEKYKYVERDSSGYITFTTEDKKYLERKGVKFRYFDITEDLGYLKFLLKYRDERAEFDQLKKEGKIGIPCLMVGDGEEFVFDIEEADLSKWS